MKFNKIINALNRILGWTFLIFGVFLLLTKPDIINFDTQYVGIICFLISNNIFNYYKIKKLEKIIEEKN